MTDALKVALRSFEENGGNDDDDDDEDDGEMEDASGADSDESHDDE